MLSQLLNSVCSTEFNVLGRSPKTNSLVGFGGKSVTLSSNPTYCLRECHLIWQLAKHSSRHPSEFCPQELSGWLLRIIVRFSVQGVCENDRIYILKIKGFLKKKKQKPIRVNVLRLENHSGRYNSA